jgi:hypothetical protein
VSPSPRRTGRAGNGSPTKRGSIWWDGNRYTARAEWDGNSWDMRPVPGTPPAPVPRPHAKRLARNSMVGLIIAGCVTLAAGATQVEEKPCDVSVKTYTYTDASGTWLPWFVLGLLAVFGVVVWRRWAPRVRWIKTMAVLGVAAAVVTCPVTQSFLSAAECGV